LVDYERDEVSGRQFLRIIVIDRKFRAIDQDFITLKWLVVLRFDEQEQEFQLDSKNTILLEALSGPVDSNYYRSSDDYLSAAHRTFFFRKELKANPSRDKQHKSLFQNKVFNFQVYKHELEIKKEFDFCFESPLDNDEEDSK